MNDLELCQAIGRRAAYAWADHRGDLYAALVYRCHTEACPLRLAAMLDGPTWHLLHDVGGLENHLEVIDVYPARLRACFEPRYADTAERSRRAAAAVIADAEAAARLVIDAATYEPADGCSRD